MIYYLVPDTETPSWGLAILYHHVAILIKSGRDACIIKDGHQRSPAWMDVKVPIETVSNFKRNATASDTVIVPEVMVNEKGLKAWKARKILFLQAGCFLFQELPKNESHASLGFDHVWIIMPHMEQLIKKHVGLPYTMVPPFIAPYFFADGLGGERKKQVLMFPKFKQVDYALVKHIITKHIYSNKKSFLHSLVGTGGWQLKELKAMEHKEVARAMQGAACFVSINVFEALNTAVVEAMAAGCIVFCYEGIGPRDYLRNGENAFVFGNNEAYALAEKVCAFMDSYEEEQSALEAMRKQAAHVAAQYSEAATAQQLLRFFDN